MRNFMQFLVCALALPILACAQGKDLTEEYELREPGTVINLQLRADGTATFSREIEEASGTKSKFRSKSGTWTKCKSANAQATETRSNLKSTECFIVEVDGVDEQGETRFGMMFVRKGDSIVQLTESGPSFVLKRRDAGKN